MTFINMKKNILSIICIAAALCACTKEQLAEKTVNSDQEQLITATVNMDNTKLAFSENQAGGGAGLASKWEEGDTFYAYAGSELIKFTLTSGAGTATATFQAKAKGIKDDTQWLGVFGNKASVVSGELQCSYLDQDGTLANIADYSYMTASATGKEPVFNFANGDKHNYILRVKLPAGIKCIEYTPCAWTKITSSGATLQYYNTGSEKDYKTYEKFSTITLSETSTAGNIVYLVLPLANYANDNGARWGKNNRQVGNLKAGVIITIMNDVSDNATLSTGTVFNENLSAKGGKIATLDLSGETLIARAKPTDAICVEKTGDIQCKLHTSALTQKAKEVKTYWSPFNIGATKPSEIGNYYAWSEYKTKTTYDFPKFINRHKPDGTNNANDCMATEFYINGTKYGFSIANTRFDTARILWGSAWRMPHMIEVYVASNGCTSYSNVDGQAGVTFNGSIFIPNSRYMDGSKLNDGTTSVPGDDYDCARFWSADQINRSYDGAGWNEVYTFGTEKTSAEYDYWRRQQHLGFPIRPVLNSSILK